MSTLGGRIRTIVGAYNFHCNTFFKNLLTLVTMVNYEAI